MAWAGWENFGALPQKEKDPARQLQGYRSRDLGETLENIVEAACLQLKLRKAALIEKTPEPFRVTDKKYDRLGKFLGFIGFFTKPAQPDFKGTAAGGRSVCFEAKATMENRIESKAVTETQNEALEKHWELGADVFVIVSLGLSKFYRVPWDVWRQMKERYGRKFMTEKDLDPFKISFSNGVLKFL